MNKSFLTIGLSLALMTTILSTAPTISDAASNTAESTYTASFTVQKPEKVVVPGEETSAELPSVSDWGFNSHLFIVSRIPCFYERAKKAYAVIQTGEERQYGNLILVKGVVL